MVIAIVAIPTSDDRVWKMSSEKIPHVTLLALDDNLANVEHVRGFIQHAADTMLRSFQMITDHRGILGDSMADVLFFKKSYSQQLSQFRDNLLTDPDISTAYNSITQFPKWIPHLTLGYPESPAKKEADDFPTEYGSVTFDRIALWTGDYEGVEFPLKNNDQEELSQAERGQAFIAHFGVKGMHWGHHKAQKAAAKAEKSAAKANKKWTKSAVSSDHFVKVHNATAARMNNGEIDRFNNQPKYKGKDFTNDSPLRRQYYKDYGKLFIKTMNEESDKLLGPSPDGKQRLEFESHDDGDSINFVIKEIKHADSGDVVFLAKKDARGRIISIEIVSDEMAQSNASDLEEYLAHYGVKGMHWGQRKSEAEAAKAQGVSDRNDARMKTISENDRRARVSDKVKQKQLLDLKPSNDHKSAAFVRTKAKVSGVETLTNHDLQTVITRMNLEMQYSNLKKAEHEQSLVGAGKKWAADFATDVAKDAAASWLKRPGSGSSSSDRGPIKVKAWTTGQQFGDQIESNRRRAIGS